MKKALCLFLALLLLLSASACRPSRQSVSYYDLFDTSCSLTVYGLDENDFDTLAAGLHELLLRFHRQSDIYHEYDEPNLATVNRLAGSYAVTLPAELCDFLQWCFDAYELSSGRVNICLGAVTSLWHEARITGVEPAAESLQEASLHCSVESLEIDGSTVRLSDPLSSLDVGALAKGYAGRLAAAYLKEQGIANYLLNLGGSLICAGKPLGTGRQSYLIGIQSPGRADGSFATTLRLNDACVATSGDYQRYVEINGVRYHHIIDPDTLYPSCYQHSVTVICDDSALCDLLSTALFLMTEDEGRALAEKWGARVIYLQE